MPQDRPGSQSSHWASRTRFSPASNQKSATGPLTSSDLDVPSSNENVDVPGAPTTSTVAPGAGVTVTSVPSSLPITRHDARPPKNDWQAAPGDRRAPTYWLLQLTVGGSCSITRSPPFELPTMLP